MSFLLQRLGWQALSLSPWHPDALESLTSRCTQSLAEVDQTQTQTQFITAISTDKGMCRPSTKGSISRMSETRNTE
jgi:hypothetical protein